jgi:gas vesicle protein
MSNDRPTSEEIKADIERKRSEVSEKIDTIQDRLSPQHLKHQAQESVQEMVKESTDKLLGYFNENVQQLPATLMDTVKRNPVPAALIGVGIGWLLLESANAKRDEYHHGGYQSARYGYESPKMFAQGSSYSGQYSDQWRASGADGQEEQKGMLGQAREKIGEMGEQVRDTVQDAVQEVGHRASQWGDQVSSMGSQTGEKAAQWQSATTHQIQHVVESNPLVVGAVAFAAGAALAMALPATRRESQLMGEMRDRVVDTAQQVAGDVAQRVQHVAEEIKPELEETARKAVEGVKQTGKEAAGEIKQTFQHGTEAAKEETNKVLAKAQQTQSMGGSTVGAPGDQPIAPNDAEARAGGRSSQSQPFTDEQSSSAQTMEGFERPR